MKFLSKSYSGSLNQLKYFNFFMFGSWSLLNPFLPLYFQHIGFQNTQIGLLMTVGPLVSLIANPFWGYWSDRLQNTRLIIIIMMTGNLATSQIYFQSNRFLFVFWLMLLFYFFQTALNPLTNSLTLHSIENTEYHFGTFRLWGSIGFAVMVLVASPFIQMIGIENLGFLYGGFVVITLLLSFRLPNPEKIIKRSMHPKKEFSKLLKSGLFVSFLLLSVLISIPNRMNSIFISVYISNLGGNEIYVGWSWFIAAALEVPLFILLDRYLKTTERVMFGLMAIVCALFTLRWLFMAAATTPLQIVFIQLLHCFTFGITYYVGTQVCDYLVPKTVRSSGQAIYGLCWTGIAGIVGGMLGGWIVEYLGEEQMYVLCAIMSALAVVGFAMIWRHYVRQETVQITKQEQHLHS